MVSFTCAFTRFALRSLAHLIRPTLHFVYVRKRAATNLTMVFEVCHEGHNVIVSMVLSLLLNITATATAVVVLIVLVDHLVAATE